MKTTLHLSTSALLLAALTACDETGTLGSGIPLDGTEATLTVNANVRGSLISGARSVRFLNDSSVLEGLGYGGTVVVTCEVEGTCEEDPEPGLRYDLEDEAADIADWVAENLFVEDFVESERGNTVTYLIPPSVICADVFGVDEAPSTEPTEGPSCEDTFTEVPIRLRVTSPREGDVDIELLVGDDRVNPLDVRAHQTELGGEVDLGATKRALEELLGAAGAEVELPAVMQGRVAASLALLGDEHARLTVSVPAAIEVSSSGDASFSFSLDASVPAAQVEFDGVAETLSALIDLGALDFSWDTGMFGAQVCSGGPGEEPICESADSHRMAAHFGGASGSVTLSRDSETIAIEGVGLGDEASWVSLDGQDLVRLDLNAASGRRLDLTASAVDESAEVTVTPGLALAVVLSFANDVSGFFDAPAWAAAETITIDLDGDAAPTVRVGESSDGNGVIQVVRGTLHAASTFLGLDVVASAGECAWQEVAEETDPFADEPHPLEGILSGACPE